MVRRCRFGNHKESHVEPSEEEAEEETKVDWQVEEERTDPAKEKICDWELLEGQDDVPGHERNERVKLALGVALAAAHEDDQDDMVDRAVRQRHGALLRVGVFTDIVKDLGEGETSHQAEHTGPKRSEKDKNGELPS